jgi:MscS family membrane protein
VWLWIAIAVGVILALALASIVSRALLALVGRLVVRIADEPAEHELVTRLRGGIRLVALALAIRLLGDMFESLLARQLWARLSAVVAVIGFTWLAIQACNAVSALVSRRLLKRGQTGKLAIVSLARRLVNILTVTIACIVLLHGAGVNVTAMLAGVGVGGIALALAAQKTLENLFGGISLIMREAIRVGDFCKLADQTGTIEDIGLGSTSVRTLDRTLISVPNAQISQMNLENFSLRDKFWFHHVLGLRRETSPEQMRNVLDGVAQMLRSHPKVEKETSRVQFIAVGSSSLDIEVFAYVKEAVSENFLRVQQELLLAIIDIVAASGTALSLPSQTTYVEGQSQAAIAEENVMQNGGGPP